MKLRERFHQQPTYGSIPVGIFPKSQKSNLRLLWAFITAASVISISILFFSSTTADIDAWAAYKQAYKLVFTSSEDELREMVFRENMEKISVLEDASSTATFAWNRFMHLKADEMFQHASKKPVKQPSKPNGFFVSWYAGEVHTGARIDNPETLPDAFDWTDHGAVTPIKDQGDLGSCWTFASIESAESAWWMKGHPLVRISAQQLLDCLRPTCEGPDCGPNKLGEKDGCNYDRIGDLNVCDNEICMDGDCNYMCFDNYNPATQAHDDDGGGLAEDAMRYYYHHGFTGIADYPYLHGICEGRESRWDQWSEHNFEIWCNTIDFCQWNHTNWMKSIGKERLHRVGLACMSTQRTIDGCETQKLNPIGHVDGLYLVSYSPVNARAWEKIAGELPSETLSEERMKEALVRVGPLTIYMNAGPIMGYETGVLDVPVELCDPLDLDHVLQLVGYGTENGVDYWRIRNSWGPFWGEEGYFRIKRGVNMCGMATEVFAAYA